MKPVVLIIFFIQVSYIQAQSINTSVPKKIKKQEKYIFYLHGRIIEEQGKNAVHPVYGEYKYQDILDSLKKYNFNVISEARYKNTDEILYAEKVVKQIDTLLKAGVAPISIYIMGASKGAYITLWISAKANNNQLNFIIMGACSEETSTIFNTNKLCGNFLSIYEISDEWGTSCVSLFSNQPCVTGFQEIKLTLNNKHGFLYQPFSEWLKPMIEWTNTKK